MSTRYKFVDNCVVYFNTSTIAGWTDVFKREMYKKIFLDGVRNCQQNHSFKIYTWVLIINYFYTICSCKEGYDFSLVWRNIKSFTVIKLIIVIINNSK